MMRSFGGIFVSVGMEGTLLYRTIYSHQANLIKTNKRDTYCTIA